MIYFKISRRVGRRLSIHRNETYEEMEIIFTLIGSLHIASMYGVIMLNPINIYKYYATIKIYYYIS
jgi:hypothetical protein